ncbi:hypothetical protein ACFFV7_50915 [Nonomuraea spiralis]|uniref:Uncharacterized protein n=1 Tax=Nonomuraea spiralis TaxID=46182 RepID=A0ABV5IYC4_9ACTN|nr:hypothetical protein [Nonomuraea spiralis]GGS88568.1 hypothetical protein GCM10010176_035430 [Nonomuraea spiralis]
MVYLFWRWPDSTEHAERKAAYESLEAALGQAEADLARCASEGDYSAAPVRIEDELGGLPWTADLPDGG